MIPRLTELDSAAAVFGDGYRFGGRRFERVGDDAFRARFLGIPAVFMRGSDAARFFYEGGRFDRTAALPPSVSHLLQDRGSVQTLEGADHRHRKEYFVDSLTGASALEGLTEAVDVEWRRALADWVARDRVVLGEEVPLVLGRAVLAWSGIDLAGAEADRRSRELLSMIDNAGRLGPPNWMARARRMGTERWARGLVRRERELGAQSSRVLSVVARATDRDGRPLPVDVAAIELLNVLRPFVAIERFVLFGALGLRRRPDLAAAFRDGDETLLEAFTHEVRRFYPFFPFIAGRATRTLEWHGHEFVAGSLAMLDLYGTDHDPGLWGDPEVFRPERFAGGAVAANLLIAQGGGTILDDHRCPGEPATVGVLKQCVRLLSRAMTYELPAQDLRVSLRTLPASPNSGIILSDVAVRDEATVAPSTS